MTISRALKQKSRIEENVRLQLLLLRLVDKVIAHQQYA